MTSGLCIEISITLTLYSPYSGRVMPYIPIINCTHYSPYSGRVRPEAADIARAHTSGSVGLLFEAMAHPPVIKSKYKREYENLITL